MTENLTVSHWSTYHRAQWLGGHGSSEDIPNTTGERARGHFSGMGIRTSFFPQLSSKNAAFCFKQATVALFSLQCLEDGHKGWKNTHLI